MRLDKIARDTRLSGIHFELAELPEAHRLELYVLTLDAGDRSNRRSLTTAGIRARRPASLARWHYELEAVAQRGESTGTIEGNATPGLDHRADFYHAEIGYTLHAVWSPVLAIRYDRASGDEDPKDRRNGRFDTLFGARRFDLGPTGIHGPYARANLETLGLRAEFKPAPQWRGLMTYGGFRLASARDAWTTTDLREVSGEAGAALGRQAEISFEWEAREDRLAIEAGSAYFTKGAFIERVAPELGGPSVYSYVQVSVSF